MTRYEKCVLREVRAALAVRGAAFGWRLSVILAGIRSIAFARRHGWAINAIHGSPWGVNDRIWDRIDY